MKYVDCPVCDQVSVGRCRCMGPHDVEMLRKGHGQKCAMGHRWDYQTGLTIDKSGEVVRKPCAPSDH